MFKNFCPSLSFCIKERVTNLINNEYVQKYNIMCISCFSKKNRYSKYYTNFKIQSSSYADWYLPRPVFKRNQWQTITDAFAQFPGKFTKNSLWGIISRPLLPVLQFRKAIIKKYDKIRVKITMQKIPKDVAIFSLLQYPL